MINPPQNTNGMTQPPSMKKNQSGINRMGQNGEKVDPRLAQQRAQPNRQKNGGKQNNPITNNIKKAGKKWGSIAAISSGTAMGGVISYFLS